MRGAYDVATVRAAEAALMAVVPEGTLMQRAATGLARVCTDLLKGQRGRVVGSRVVLLVGSGSNGGDALWAGSFLARRGARVDALLLSAAVHEEGLAALRAAGGAAAHLAGAPGAHGDGSGTPPDAADLLRRADLVLDGIVGIGGRGPLRPEAAALARSARDGAALVVAVDLPSGIDPDTGAVADLDAVVPADVTVTFGCWKQGLLLAPARAFVGVVELVDIGLGPVLPVPLPVATPEWPDLAALVPEPAFADHKYSRGVVGILAGSGSYPGAALLCVGGARRGDVGMVRYLDRGDGLAARVVERFPDVVAWPGPPGDDPRVRAWACGPGIGAEPGDRALLLEILAASGPVVLDADALRFLADPAGEVRQAIAGRADADRVTVITPHEGEFARLGYDVGSDAATDRLGAARRAAADLGCVVLLKGPGTVVAAPDGGAYVCGLGPATLATAGSGDVLTGLLGALLAGDAARQGGGWGPGASAHAAAVAAGAATLHGLAAAWAGDGGRPVAADDLVAALPLAIAGVRAGG